ncbi:MAG TPA: hypothetical protein VN815_05010, partial [Steroidobacteraceae bacterium]|nr:hypothetical protein [Steroidobacteraceae bacterium]
MTSPSPQVLVSKRVPSRDSFRQKSITPSIFSRLYPTAFNLFAWASNLAASGSSDLAALAAGVDSVDGAMAFGVADTAGGGGG